MRRDPFCRLSPLANGVNYLRNNASALLSYVYMMLSIARADILQLFEFIQYFKSHSVENFIKQRIKGSFVSRSSGRIIYVSSLCSRLLTGDPMGSQSIHHGVRSSPSRHRTLLLSPGRML